MTGVGALNPQGDDSGKGLLEFAEGKALGEDGLQWLYIHTQNVWGNDKCSLQDRIDATEDNLYQYRQYAADPLNCTGWMEADKPFCFLACCFELLDLGENPEEHVSHLPIALDGSCSGLQHFAAMMLDEKLAEAVNVIQNSDRPNDIYTMVAERAAASVAEDDSEEASYWNGKVTRDIVKQPVMTLAYGVSRSGMRNQVSEKCKKLVRKGHSEYKKGSTSVKDADGKVVVSFAGYMADQIHDSISGVSKSAFHVMDWLGAAATAKAAACDDAIDGALSWTSPIGLPVLQEYYDYDSKRVNTYFEGRRIRFTQRLGAAAVDARKQKQGAAPNFVHSMDAAHLMLTVNECIGSGIGINSFAMIHDSFGTHASDTGALFEILREQFHLMYREDALMHLYADLPPAAKLICGEPPSRGSLDLSRVQDSEYFFN
jgi:DNA-directed RNA polymerase